MYAADAFGAASRATFGVVVSAYEGEIDDLSEVMDNVAKEALAAGDTDTVMQVYIRNQVPGFLGWAENG